jgi:hypothetical protein
MWIYRMKSEYEYEVGYMEIVYNADLVPYHQFMVAETHASKNDARKAVNYLNGGNPEVEVSGVIHDKI